MPIDDPLSSLELLNNSDERQRSLIFRYSKLALNIMKTVAPDLVSKLCIDGFSAVFDFQERRSKRNWDELMKVMQDEWKYRGEQIRKLIEADESRRLFMETEFPGLVLDAIGKAELAREVARVRRLGLVLVHSLEVDPVATGDYVEEMLIVAMALGKEDVHLLGQIDEVQRPLMNDDMGRVGHYHAQNSWDEVSTRLKEEGMVEGRIDSICSRLEGHGLVTKVERYASSSGRDRVPYALLEKGSDFIDYLKSSAPSEHV